jgi:hypothetical protein
MRPDQTISDRIICTFKFSSEAILTKRVFEGLHVQVFCRWTGVLLSGIPDVDDNLPTVMIR